MGEPAIHTYPSAPSVPFPAPHLVHLQPFGSPLPLLLFPSPMCTSSLFFIFLLVFEGPPSLAFLAYPLSLNAFNKCLSSGTRRWKGGGAVHLGGGRGLRAARQTATPAISPKQAKGCFSVRGTRRSFRVTRPR
eukprot:Sspe_Gene.106457::Locus_84495_Transcript_1_1_Confidence_1.000_Length_900::g.106457::m.106457